MSGYESELEVLRDLFLCAVDEDANCRALRRHLDRLLAPSAPDDPEHRYVLVSDRARDRLRDAITFYALEATDLCAALAPVAIMVASDLFARSLAQEDLLEIRASVRQQTMPELFANAGLSDRHRPLATA